MEQRIAELKQDIVAEMMGYMNDVITDGGDAPYTQADVEQSDALLNAFIIDVDASAQKAETEWMHERVKALVVALNDLNDSADGALIETDQREGICELIDMVMSNAGHDVTEDITEAWRDW